MKQTYAQKVLNALRDDGQRSLSFKGLEDMTVQDMRNILPIAAVYGVWLDAVKKRAEIVLGAEAEFILRSMRASPGQKCEGK